MADSVSTAYRPAFGDGRRERAYVACQPDQQSHAEWPALDSMARPLLMRRGGRRKMARRQPFTRKMKAARSPRSEAGGKRRRAPAGAEGAQRGAPAGASA
jgi:hypothetical protein